MHLTSRTPCKLCARGAVFQPTFLCVVLPRIIVWGSCFLLCALAVRDRLRTQLSLPQFCHTRTQLCHTHTHTQLCHIQLCHAQLFFTRNSHTHTHTTLCHAFGDMHGRRGTYGTGLALVAHLVSSVARGVAWLSSWLYMPGAPRHFAWQAWRLVTSALILRGRRGAL